MIFFSFGTLINNPIELLEVDGFSIKVISLGSGTIFTIGLKRESITKNVIKTVFFFTSEQTNERSVNE